MPASTATASHAGAQEPTMTATDAVPAPTASAEDIGNRILRLIDSMQSQADLSPAHVQQVTGIQVGIDPHDSLNWGFGGAVDAQWTYGLSSMKSPDGKAVDGLLFSFEPAQGQADDNPAPVCTPDLDYYRKSLEQRGFSAKPLHGRFGVVDRWLFERDGVCIGASLRRNPKSREPLACVHQLIINAR